MKQRFLFLLLIVNYCQLSFSQHATLSGYIVNKNSSEPVEYATVSLYKANDSIPFRGTISNVSGHYMLNDLPPGSYRVKFGFIGFADQVMDNILIQSSRENILLDTVFLELSATEIEGVEIEGTKPRIEYQLDRKVINVSSDISLAGGTAVNAMENVPSVEVDAEGNVTLRGSGSFTVLIDGQPTPLKGTDALKQIPAVTIEKIEVITNPSAEYDPDGQTGIINVILKKNKTEGMNGLLELSAGYNHKYAGNFSFNYRKKNYKFFAFLSYRDDLREHSMNNIRTLYPGTDTSILDTRSSQKNWGKRVRLKINNDFTFNRHQLSINTAIGNDRDTRYSNASQYRFAPLTGDEYYLLENSYLEEENDFDLAANYQYKFPDKGRELKGYASFSGDLEEEDNLQQVFSSDMNWNRLNTAYYLPSIYEDKNRYLYRLKLDYKQPLKGDYKVETGLHQWYENNNNNYRLDNYDVPSGLWIPDPLYTSITSFDQYTMAYYLTFQGKMGKLGYKIGGRGEYTDRIIGLRDQSNLTISRWDVYPTLHLSYQLPKKIQVQASYSRRVHRPDGWQLSPDTTYMSEFHLRVGNPNLIPDFSDSWELNFTKEINKKSNVSWETYYRTTNNQISWVSLPVRDNIFVQTYENLSSSKNFGTSVSTFLGLAKWFNLYAGFNLYKNIYQGLIGDEMIDREGTSYSSHMSMQFMFSKQTKLELRPFYWSGGTYVQGENKEYYNLSVTARQALLKNKLAFILSCRNVFKVNWNYSINTATYSESYYGEPEYPNVKFTLEYSFNNYQGPRDGSNGDNGGEGEGGSPGMGF